MLHFILSRPFSPFFARYLHSSSVEHEKGVLWSGNCCIVTHKVEVLSELCATFFEKCGKSTEEWAGPEAFTAGLHQNNWILRRDFICSAVAGSEGVRLWDCLMLPTCCWWNIELVFGGGLPTELGWGIFRLQSISRGLRNNTYWGEVGGTSFSLLIPYPFPHFSSPFASSVSGLARLITSRIA